jgi:ATP-dependent DNA helicase RecG
MSKEANTFAAAHASDETLSSSLQYVKGVGPVRAGLLERLHIHTLYDLLLHFPVAHKDRASVTPVFKVKAGSEVNVVAQIVDVRGKRMNGRERVEALLRDDSGEIRAGWWNPYVADKLTPNAWGFFSGKVGLFNERRELGSPEFEILGNDETVASGVRTGPSFGRIVPLYNLRPKQRLANGQAPAEIRIRQADLRKIVWQVLERGLADRLEDELPRELCRACGLVSMNTAVRQFHFPDTQEAAIAARRRLVFEELFIIAIGVALRRAQVARLATPHLMPLNPAIKTRIEARLPFTLTPSQTQAFQEIARDMAAPIPMNRLLQGDVGCGKTAVAVSAMLLCVAHGRQAALLAPTEVLAEQHYRTLQKMLADSRVKISLLRGGGSGGERAEVLRALGSGEAHIAIGTHALLEDDVVFKSLGLAVIDEQHKFGVSQRMSLRRKGKSPHVLVLTATPIPRTLTLTLYGDLDVSRIGQPPPGRGEIVTKWVRETSRADVCKLIVSEAAKGHATYVVLPRIDENTAQDAASADDDDALASGGKPKAKKRGAPKLWNEVKGAEAELKRLREQLPTLRIDLLHGRMKGDAKDAVLAKLRDGQLDVLVSTQVIEVGIDLPGATVMVIENAEMFGLSALHQLRGRVGRSELKSYCLFFASANNEEGEQRLKTFVSTRDGFKIAEADFKLRGPGQFFGTQQSGLPELKIADLILDEKILIEARDAAFALVARDSRLTLPEHAALRRRVSEVLGGKLGLVDMG